MPQAHPRSSGNLNDTHPRFSRDGKKVCIDSPHGLPAVASAEAGGNGRQLYLIDISKIVANPPTP